MTRKRKQTGKAYLEIQISESKYPGTRLRTVDSTAATSRAVLTCSSKRYQRAGTVLSASHSHGTISSTLLAVRHL